MTADVLDSKPDTLTPIEQFKQAEHDRAKAGMQPPTKPDNWRVLAGKKRAFQVNMKELGKLGGKAPHTNRGRGRTPKPTKCRRCPVICPSAREAWRHCYGVPRRTKADGPYVPYTPKPRGRPKGSGLGNYTKRKS